MYLSRLILNPRNRLVRHDLADCQSLHRTILSVFPAKSNAGGAREEFGILHRLEPSRRGALLVLLVQSAELPDWTRLPPAYLTSPAGRSNPATASLCPLLDSLQSGDTLRFRLRANPTRKVDTKSGPNGERRNGRRVKLKTEAEQVAWLTRKAAEGGFEVLTVHSSANAAAMDVIDEGQAQGWRPGVEGQHRRLVFGAVLFDGHLRIGDPVRFRQTLEYGLGPGKAYGFGLLSVARDGATRQ
jgi:CRISPR system Cascade subunit CasE